MENEKISTKINFGSAGFKKYFSNTFWLFTDKVFRLLVAFIVNIYVVQYLGPSYFGLLSYAISFAGLFSTISFLGLENILIRELVKNPQRDSEHLGTVFFLSILGSFLSIGLLSIGVLITGDTGTNLIMIYIIAFSTFLKPFSVIDYYFQAKVLSKNIVYVQLITVFITSVFKIIFIIEKASVIYFGIIFTAEYILLAIGFVSVYKLKNFKIFNWKFNKEAAYRMLKDSWPLLFSSLVVAVYMKIGQIMIMNMLDEKQVGYYSVSVKLSEAWYFIPMVITSSLFPAVISGKALGEGIYLSRIQKLYDLMTWIAIAIAIPTSIFSSNIIIFLYGAEFSPSAPVLTVYIWASISVFLGVASNHFLITENLAKVAFYRTLVGMLLNVILNIVLIPIIGILGSALAALVSYSMATFSMYFNQKTRAQVIMMFKSIFGITLINYLKQNVNINKTKN